MKKYFLIFSIMIILLLVLIMPILSREIIPIIKYNANIICNDKITAYIVIDAENKGTSNYLNQDVEFISYNLEYVDDKVYLTMYNSFNLLKQKNKN